MKKPAVLLLALLLQACAEKPAQSDWMIVNYWAIWCAPCREEIPAFNTLASESGVDLAVRSVNFDDVQDEALSKQRKELGIEFPSLSAGEKALLNPQPSHPLTLPTTYIYYKNQLQSTLQGPQTLASLRTALSTNKQP